MGGLLSEEHHVCGPCQWKFGAKDRRGPEASVQAVIGDPDEPFECAPARQVPLACNSP
jgi:hypothetical protein